MVCRLSDQGCDALQEHGSEGRFGCLVIRFRSAAWFHSGIHFACRSQMVSEIRCWNGICGIDGAEALETALKEAAVDAYLDLAPRARARHTLAYYMSWAAACRTAGRPGTIMFGVAEGKSGRGWRQAFLTWR